jgi:hypothetical protein
MTNEATKYWSEVQQLLPWMSATDHNRRFVEGYRRGKLKAEDTAEIITQLVAYEFA